MTVRRLPVVIIRGKPFLRDDRLEEFRAVNNPHERISFDDDDGPEGGAP